MAFGEYRFLFIYLLFCLVKSSSGGGNSTSAPPQPPTTQITTQATTAQPTTSKSTTAHPITAHPTTSKTNQSTQPHNQTTTQPVNQTTTQPSTHPTSTHPTSTVSPTAHSKDCKSCEDELDSEKHYKWVAVAFDIIFAILLVIMTILYLRQRKMYREMEGDGSLSRLI